MLREFSETYDRADKEDAWVARSDHVPDVIGGIGLATNLVAVPISNLRGPQTLVRSKGG